jgi:hypothetical protein
MARVTLEAGPLPLPLAGSRVAIEASGTPGELRIRRFADGVIVGHATLEPRVGELHIAELIIDEGHRGYGAGTEAARLLIDAAEAAGFERITAWAPPNLGLAAYFWHRMGLHALHGPGPGGGILFERLLR